VKCFENGFSLPNQIQERRAEKNLQAIASIREDSASSSDENINKCTSEFISSPALRNQTVRMFAPQN